VWVVRRPQGGRLTDLAAAFRDGVLSVVRTRRTPALVASTVALWACYALMADFPLRLLGISQAYDLTHLDAWAVMAVGGIGMALPAPGGTGSFHYATVQVLTLLFAVSVTPAATYAVLVHAAGIVFYAVFGGLSLVMQGARLSDVTRSARATADAP
jgi:glycosyltransferase 2 family protein